ncbi:MAG: uracil phosphoribosyltransferase, partial [Spirochaetia bacterium]
TDLDGYLTDTDVERLQEMNRLYDTASDVFRKLVALRDGVDTSADRNRLIDIYNQMGAFMQDVAAAEPRIQVYSFGTPKEVHGEASRLIAKLRDDRTGRAEFMYYTQRAYELLFNFSFGAAGGSSKNHLVVPTPVTDPVQNFAVHKIPDVDTALENTVMCVMLRGALLPSMIMSKEIEEYSSTGYVTPFALFRIKRNDSRSEADMEYLLDLRRSFFRLEDLHDRDLVFADPMNATGGSLVTILHYLEREGVKPRSIRFFNVIAALKGALRIVRALPEATVSTLWMDPVLNDQAYILPGLGDAGDRLNGVDAEGAPRNIIQLIADYGSNISELYRSQVREIERTVLRS